MGKRAQRAGELPVGITMVDRKTSGRVPGNLDVVHSTGADMDGNQSAGRAGEAVSSRFGGRPMAGAPDAGKRQP